MMERGSGSLNAAFAFKLGRFARLRSKRLSPGVAGGLAKGVMLSALCACPGEIGPTNAARAETATDPRLSDCRGSRLAVCRHGG